MKPQVVKRLERTYLEQVGYNHNEPNYALLLGRGGVNEVVHNRFVVPDWGVLRFDLHIDQAQLRSGKQLLVSLESVDGSFTDFSSFINLEPASGYRQDYEEDTRRVSFGTQGFETFHLEIPDNLRNKAATLRFQVVGNAEVYLDNVFFKSKHLLFGNPSEARHRTNLDAADANNYLLEKPQFASAYNNSSKIPRWVSWQLNQSWLGTTKRQGNTFITDPMVPESWGRVKDQDYRGSEYQKGHMVASGDRTRNLKDNGATFVTSNVVPQHYDNNDTFRGERPDNPAWTQFEHDLRSLVNSNPSRELYIIAGGYGSYTVPQRYSHYARLDVLTVPQILTGNGIDIPEWTWKVVLELPRPGLGISDVTTSNVRTYAILTPNKLEPDHTGRKPEPDGTVGNHGDFIAPAPHPFNEVPGLTSHRDEIPNKATWRNWETWQLSVNELEDFIGLDFFSNIPSEIQEIIEGPHSPNASLLSFREHISFQSPIRHDSVAKHGIPGATSPICASEICSSQISTIHDNTTQSGIPEIDSNQQKILHKSTIKIGTAEISSRQVSTIEKGAIQIGTIQISSPQIDIFQISSGQISSAQINTTQISSSQIDTFQIGSGQISSPQINTSQVYPGNNVNGIILEVGASEIDVTQINFNEIPLTSSVALQQLLSSHLSNFHNQNPQLNSLLNNITLQITDLPSGQIAEAQITQTHPLTGHPTAGTLLLDHDANGIGWFIDPTPKDHSEFALPLTDHAFQATPSSPAHNRYDLLTAINHELFHLLGVISGHQPYDQYRHNSPYHFTHDQSHLNPILHPHDFLNPSLKPGQRLLPSQHDLHILQQIYAQTPQNPSTQNSKNAPLSAGPLQGILNGDFSSKNGGNTRGQVILDQKVSRVGNAHQPKGVNAKDKFYLYKTHY